MRSTPDDQPEFELMDADADDMDPQQVSEIFASTAAWMIEVNGAQAARDQLEAEIATQSAELN